MPFISRQLCFKSYVYFDSASNALTGEGLPEGVAWLTGKNVCSLIANMSLVKGKTGI